MNHCLQWSMPYHSITYLALPHTFQSDPKFFWSLFPKALNALLCNISGQPPHDKSSNQAECSCNKPSSEHSSKSGGLCSWSAGFPKKVILHFFVPRHLLLPILHFHPHLKENVKLLAKVTMTYAPVS